MQIEVNNLKFSYGAHTVLDGVSFDLERGKLIALMGPNGTGKSTLFRLMLGFLRPDSGSIKIGGTELRDMSNAQRAGKIAYIPQSVDPVYNYTVEEVVLMGLTGSLGVLSMPKKEHKEAVRKTLRSLGIEELSERGYARISGGERQLVLLARALVQKAGTLLMDEPTANLDYGNQHKVMKKVRDLTAEGYTVMMSTHNPEQAFLYADRVLVLCDGSLAGDGSPEQVLTGEMLQRIYGIPVLLAEENLGRRKVRICLPAE